MPKIIQFLHTGKEATPNNRLDNIIPWNNNDTHRRKFILSKGRYINENNEQVESELAFWGEWEPQSEIIRINNGNLTPPRYLNKPFINQNVPMRIHSTDPYVFGNKFKYINCMQTYFRGILLNLEPNSIILFGSAINAEFCLDTLFVVSKDYQDYNINTINNLFPINHDQYYHASVNPICNNNVNGIVGQQNYRFYKSVNFEEREQYNNIYSFVPCKVYTNPDYIFRQPTINHPQPIINHNYINGRKTQGIKATDCTLVEIVDFWNDIVQQITTKDLKKGIYFDTPELRQN
jgi:hypothetical protein